MRQVLALRATRIVRISSHSMVFLNILLNRLDKMADESGRAGEKNFRSLYIDIQEILEDSDGDEDMSTDGE